MKRQLWEQNKTKWQTCLYILVEEGKTNNKQDEQVNNSVSGGLSAVRENEG